MKFQIEDLKKLLNSVQKNRINHIYIKSPKFELNINKTDFLNKSLPNYETLVQEQQIVDNMIEQEQIISTSTEEIKNQISENYSTIVSPMVGTFYRSPAPNEESFVKQNDMIQQRQTVCIIEAMKLMNEIESEVNGEITEILVKDGDIVDCGQALMKVKILN